MRNINVYIKLHFSYNLLLIKTILIVVSVNEMLLCISLLAVLSGYIVVLITVFHCTLKSINDSNIFIINLSLFSQSLGLILFLLNEHFYF